ncbi:MAG: hypothetical protein ABF382_09140 [Akkermansiaceae bacterium]
MTFFCVVFFSGTTISVWESRDYFLPGRLHSFMMERVDLAVEDCWRCTLLSFATLSSLLAGMVAISRKNLRSH